MNTTDPNAEYYAYNRRCRPHGFEAATEPRIGYTPVDPGPMRVADPERNVCAEPYSPEPIRRFATFETDSKLYLLELLPTHRFPVNWIDGAMTREQAWRVAQSTTKTVVLPDGSEVNVYDEQVADERAYSFWVGVEASYSDAAFYAPLKFEAWCAAGKPDPYTQRPYTERV